MASFLELESESSCSRCSFVCNCRVVVCQCDFISSSACLQLWSCFSHCDVNKPFTCSCLSNTLAHTLFPPHPLYHLVSLCCSISASCNSSLALSWLTGPQLNSFSLSHDLIRCPTICPRASQLFPLASWVGGLHNGPGNQGRCTSCGTHCDLTEDQRSSSFLPMPNPSYEVTQQPTGSTHYYSQYMQLHVYMCKP